MAIHSIQMVIPFKQHHVYILLILLIIYFVVIVFCIADVTASFIWGTYLKTTGSHAAPVSYFHHVNYFKVFFFF